jgi:hypothetical protein
MVGLIDGNNSSTFPLAAGDSFAGSFVSTIDFSEILVSIETDTTYQLVVNFSSDGTNIGKQELYVIQAPVANARTFSFKPYLQFYNVNVLNTDLAPQTYLTIKSLLKSDGVNVQLANLKDYQIFQSAGTTGASSLLINGGYFPRQYTFYGDVSAPTTLTIQISPDTANWYDTQYVYTSSTGGSFGYTVPLSASYLRVVSSASVNSNMWVNSS